MIKALTAMFFAASLISCSADAPVTDDMWRLNGPASNISFISVKNGDVVEVSGFSDLSGTVSEDGGARLEVDAASVETFVDIRNERLRDIFFETSQFPAIPVTANLDPATFAALAVGDNLDMELELTVSLRGVARSVYANVRLIRNGPDSVLVVSSEPALIDARDFGLDDAVTALAEIAGLEAITPVFPVSAYLVFERG
jgi:polyisoprenoid-binding protein YceI